MQNESRAVASDPIELVTMLYDELETAVGVLVSMVRQGQRVSATEPAHRARAFGMKLLAYDPHMPPAEVCEQMGVTPQPSLEALLRDTHKFESRYLDRLVGPWPESAATYRARSPIHHVDGLSCPVIFLQGLDDKVVPPNQAEAMVAALRAKGVEVAYLTFPGEGHGFRAAAAIERALLAEHAFFCRVFGIALEEAAPKAEERT